MERNERRQLRAIAGEVADWADQARSVVAHRARIASAADAAVDALRRSVVTLRNQNTVEWRVMVLRVGDGRRLAEIATHTRQPGLGPMEDRALNGLTTEVPRALHDVKSVIGVRRLFARSAKRNAGLGAARFLTEFWAWGCSVGVPRLLHHLALQNAGGVSEIGVAHALTEQVGLTARVSDLGAMPEVVSGEAVAGLPGSIATIDQALANEARYRSAAMSAGQAVRTYEVRRMLAGMPVERLKEVTRDRLLITPLTDAGITTVLAVLDRGAMLEHIPGIGATTATRVRGAAHTLWQMTYDEMPVRIDIKNRTRETTELLRCLAAWDAVRRTRGAAADLARAATLRPLAHALGPDVSHLVVFAVGSQVPAFREAVEAVSHRARLIGGATGAAPPTDPWDDFLSRPADYFAMLSELGFLTEDEQKAHGDLPDDIVEAVRRLQLDTEYLTASLRGYQSFGARFALVQRKVIIGDEMGLGKTVEALAVLAHLRAAGHHSVVVCPAAVVTNWIREVASKSSLRPHRVHGPGREAAARNWARDGGVAVTTFETLGWFEDHYRGIRDIGCVVVDEAHYIKNPAALRTRRTRAVMDAADRVLLLTGTPLENRLDEFRNLVGYLRPDLVVDADELSPRRFRLQVAPAYLRRNQEDVLTELPELVEVREWLPMSRSDFRAYQAAVAEGNFMAMRQAAMLQAMESEKVRRLIEIVEEAGDNGRRVIVFSHFRSVLDQVARVLPGQVFGPLTGSVPAGARQSMVDQFSAAGHGAVLVAQIVAGGVGLNIQAASVVVICEPQLKPTTEWQAIARARRMGQLESVQVHRLLSEEGVDLRITEILERKRELFENFARISETAGSAPEAVDISEAELAREMIAAERERLFTQGAASSPQGEQAG